MLTPDDLKTLKPNKIIWDLVEHKFIYVCTCSNGGRRHINHVKANPQEFALAKPV